jgi:hypothetical protein
MRTACARRKHDDETVIRPRGAEAVPAAPQARGGAPDAQRAARAYRLASTMHAAFVFYLGKLGG